MNMNETLTVRDSEGELMEEAINFVDDFTKVIASEVCPNKYDMKEFINAFMEAQVNDTWFWDCMPERIELATLKRLLLASFFKEACESCEARGGKFDWNWVPEN